MPVDYETIEMLESIVRESPDDIENWLVLADALVTVNDPRGALITFEYLLENEENKRKREILYEEISKIDEENDEELYGEFRQFRDDPRYHPVNWIKETEWKGGYILHLRIIMVDPEFLEGLLSSRCCSLLQSLAIGGEIVSDELMQILEFLKIVNLSSLDLGNNKLDDLGAIMIAKSSTLRNLTTLKLGRNRIGVRGATAIANSSTLKNLTYLGLWYNKLGDDGAKAIAKSSTLKNLRVLSLEGNKIGDVGAKAIAKSSTLKNLKFLNLENNWIEVEGAMALVKSSSLKKLTHLDLRDNDFYEYEEELIAESSNVRNLFL
jgi:hypothetical protein